MAKTRPPYRPEFHRQIVDLVHGLRFSSAATANLPTTGDRAVELDPPLDETGMMRQTEVLIPPPPAHEPGRAGQWQRRAEAPVTVVRRAAVWGTASRGSQLVVRQRSRPASRATTCGNCLEALYAAILKQMENHVCLSMLGWATIKRYVRAISQNWVVYRHNPPRGAQHEFTLCAGNGAYVTAC